MIDISLSEVLGSVSSLVADRGLAKNKSVRIEAATLEASGQVLDCMRDTGERYEECLTALARAAK